MFGYYGQTGQRLTSSSSNALTFFPKHIDRLDRLHFPNPLFLSVANGIRIEITFTNSKPEP